MEEFDLRRFAKLALIKKFFLMAIMISCIGVGIFYSYYCVVPKYKSTTTILLAQTNETKTTTDDDGNTVEEEVADLSMTNTLLEPYISLVTSKKVISNVITNLDLDMTVAEVQAMLSVAEENTAMISITAISEDADLAASIANEVTNVFAQQVQEIFSITNVNVIDEAEPATIPYNVNHTKDLLLAVMVGIVLSGCFVVVVYMLDTSIKEESDIEDGLKIPVLGVIPELDKNFEKKSKKDDDKESSLRNEELILLGNQKSYVSEAFRTLRTNITFTQNTKSILITSSEMGDGKSYVAANLATAIAKTDKKVIIVDADMRKGRQDRIFKLENKYGLSNFLASGSEDTTTLDEVKQYIRTTRVPNLHIITCGAKATNPSELLNPNKVASLVHILEQIYDYVIIDGTPSNVIADCVVFSKVVSSTVLVTVWKKTKIDDAKKVIKTYEQVGAKIRGAVLNKYPVTKQAYSSSYYYDDGSKRKMLKEENEKIKSVEAVIHEASEKNPIQATLMNYEAQSKANNVERSKAAGNADINELEETVYKLQKEIVDLKSILVQSMMSTAQMTSNDINLLRNSIMTMSNHSEIEELQADIKELKELKTDIIEIKEFTAFLASSQRDGSERMRNFIEKYYSNKAQNTVNETSQKNKKAKTKTK